MERLPGYWYLHPLCGAGRGGVGQWDEAVNGETTWLLVPTSPVWGGAG